MMEEEQQGNTSTMYPNSFNSLRLIAWNVVNKFGGETIQSSNSFVDLLFFVSVHRKVVSSPFNQLDQKQRLFVSHFVYLYLT